MTDEQKEAMKEELKTVYKYDMFIDENPDVQERVERSRAQALAEGNAKGMQQLILDEIKDRFPALADQAQPLIEQIQDPDALKNALVI